MSINSNRRAAPLRFLLVASLLAAACGQTKLNSDLEPKIKVASRLDFEDVQPGSQTLRRLVITNAGRVQLRVGAITPAGKDAAAFTTSPMVPLLIDPGEENALSVSVLLVAPKKGGPIDATLEIQTNDEPRSVTLAANVRSSCLDTGCALNEQCIEKDGLHYCQCNSGYAKQGGTVCTNIDECQDPNACHTNAECTDTEGDWSCACPARFESSGTGKTVDCLDRCRDNGGCQEHSTCSVEGSNVKCICDTGFLPDDVNAPRPTCTGLCDLNNGGCHADATCSAAGNTITCECKDGYFGNGQTGSALVCRSLCELPTTCDPHALCSLSSSGVPQCECQPPYANDSHSGTDRVCLDPCQTDTDGCQEHTTCRFANGTVNCDCAPGYIVANGESGPARTCRSLCDLHPCPVHSSCSLENGTFACDCDEGYSQSGPRDDRVVCAGLCEVNNGGCDTHATCAVEGAQTVCACNAGYHGDGHTCASDCLTNNGGCDLLTTCSNARAGVVCSPCPSGYTGTGATSCVDVNECNQTPTLCGALEMGTCENRPGTYECQCNPGFAREHGQSTDRCVDVDECVEETDDCDQHALCANTSGSFTCTCVAAEGYEGNGTQCSLNPCFFDNGGCGDPDVEGTCENVTGLAVCHCLTGFSFDGLTCADVNECVEDTDGCDALTTCMNTPGAFFCTECPQGYTGSGETGCIHIGPCEQNNGGCDSRADCAVTGFDTRTCTCQEGYVGDGFTCQRDRCLVENGGCEAHATCQDNGGTATVCTCEAGYVGDGRTCALVGCEHTPTCPTLDGYALSCNVRGFCEYSNTSTDAAWKAYDVWVYEPPGSFSMGAPEAEAHSQTYERPEHTVTIAEGFFFQKYELTTAMHEACEAGGGCSTPTIIPAQPGYSRGINRVSNQRATEPQNGLSYNHAKNACAWLGRGARLPTEAEWEYAATGPTHRTYPWGEAPPTCADGGVNFAPTAGVNSDVGTDLGCGTGGTAAVDSFTQDISATGLYGMASNVGEPVLDCSHWTYAGAPADGSAWVTACDGNDYMTRGGSFINTAERLRTSMRGSGNKSDIPGAPYQGVRCVRPLPEPSCVEARFDDQTTSGLQSEGNVSVLSSGCHDGPGCARLASPSRLWHSFSQPLIGEISLSAWFYPEANWPTANANASVALSCDGQSAFHADIWAPSAMYVHPGMQTVAHNSPSEAWTRVEIQVDTRTGQVRYLEGGEERYSATLTLPCTRGIDEFSLGASAVSGYSASYRFDGVRAGPLGCEVDSCTTNNGGCDPLTACSDEGETVACGACPPGYVGTGETGCVADPCATNRGGCDTNASCAVEGAQAVCTCNAGYSPFGPQEPGTTCAAVNTCLAPERGDCDANATCNYSGPGTNTCTCSQGYEPVRPQEPGTACSPACTPVRLGGDGGGRWIYRRAIPVAGSPSGVLSPYVITVTLDVEALVAAGKVQPTGTDIRFVSASGEELAWWVAGEIQTQATPFRVRLETLPVDGTVIYLYYSNPRATLTGNNVDNGRAVFPVFDDFDAPTLDASKWTVYSQSPGFVATGNSAIQLKSPGPGLGWAILEADTAFSGGSVAELDYTRQNAPNLSWKSSQTVVRITPQPWPGIEETDPVVLASGIEGWWSNAARECTVADGDYSARVEVDAQAGSFRFLLGSTVCAEKTFQITAPYYHSIVAMGDGDLTLTIRGARIRPFVSPEPVVGALGPEELTSSDCACPPGYLGEGFPICVARFKDNGDGTATDTISGKVWTIEPAASLLNQSSAVAYCEGLALGGSTSWHLPSIFEARALLAGTGADDDSPTCTVGAPGSCTANSCGLQVPSAHCDVGLPAYGGAGDNGYYLAPPFRLQSDRLHPPAPDSGYSISWTSTMATQFIAWNVYFHDGIVVASNNTNKPYSAWCVHD